MSDGEPSFWDFSLRTYDRDEAEQACLFLQDETGADVNLLLLCCFVARHGVRLTPSAMETLIRQASVWQQEVVQVLRALRHRLKQPVGCILPEATGALRQAVQDAELEAERLEQEMLQAVLHTVGGLDGRHADRQGLARRNMLDYLGFLESSITQPVREAMERLIGCAFPEDLR